MGSFSRWLRAGILLIVPACWFVLIVGRGTAEPPGGGAVELKDVKYNGLVEAVKAQRGKVVVVDVWATSCPPCVRNYPHVLQMQQEHRSEGLVCISVSVDLPKAKPAALDFLKKKNSAITNFWLDELPIVWGKNWGVNGPPVMFCLRSRRTPSRQVGHRRQACRSRGDRQNGERTPPGQTLTPGRETTPGISKL